MKNEPTTPPTTLTDEQTAMVSGGINAAIGLVRAGCPTCTSGMPVAFQAYANLVDPAPMVQTLA
jgi:hypothetical protein